MSWNLITKDYDFKASTLPKCREDYVEYLAVTGKPQQEIISLSCEFMEILFSEKSEEERQEIDMRIEEEVIQRKEKAEEERAGFSEIEADFRAAII